MDIGHVVAFIDLVVGIFVLGFGISAFNRLRGGTLSWAALFLSISGFSYVVHAASEVFGFGQELYSVTALLVILILGFTLIIFDMTLKLLGVKS
ncbi:MAG: hypothetical protein ACE5IH_04710 [Thermodesulfobacteriota bacterium]